MATFFPSWLNDKPQGSSGDIVPVMLGDEACLLFCRQPSKGQPREEIDQMVLQGGDITDPKVACLGKPDFTVAGMSLKIADKP